MRKLSPLLLALLISGCSLIVRNKLDDEEPPQGDSGVTDLPTFVEGGVFPVEVAIKRERDAQGEPYLIGERFFVQLRGEGAIREVWLQPFVVAAADDPRTRSLDEIWCPCETMTTGPMPLDRPAEEDPGESLPDEPLPGEPLPAPPVQEWQCSIPPRAPEAQVGLRVEYHEANQGGVTRNSSYVEEITIQRLLLAGGKDPSELQLVSATDLRSIASLPLPGVISSSFFSLSPSGRYLLLACNESFSAAHYVVVDLITQTVHKAPFDVNTNSLDKRFGVFEGRTDYLGTPLPEQVLWVLGKDRTPTKLELPSDLHGELREAPIADRDLYPITQQLVALRRSTQSVIVGLSGSSGSSGPSGSESTLFWLTSDGGYGSTTLENLTTVQAMIPVQDALGGDSREALGGNDALVLLGTRDDDPTGSQKQLAQLYRLDEATGEVSLKFAGDLLVPPAVVDLGPIPGTGFFSLRFTSVPSSPAAGSLQFGWLQDGRLTLQTVEPHLQSAIAGAWRVLPTAYGSDRLAAVVPTLDNLPSPALLFTLFDGPSAPDWNSLPPLLFPLNSRYAHHPVDQRFFSLQPGKLAMWSYDFDTDQDPPRENETNNISFEVQPDTELLIQP